MVMGGLGAGSGAGGPRGGEGLARLGDGQAGWKGVTWCGTFGRGLVDGIRGSLAGGYRVPPFLPFLPSSRYPVVVDINASRLICVPSLALLSAT